MKGKASRIKTDVLYITSTRYCVKEKPTGFVSKQSFYVIIYIIRTRINMEDFKNLKKKNFVHIHEKVMKINPKVINNVGSNVHFCS